MQSKGKGIFLYILLYINIVGYSNGVDGNGASLYNKTLQWCNVV